MKRVRAGMPSFGKKSSEHRFQEVEVSKKLRSRKAKETVRHVYVLNRICSWLFRPCKFFYCDTRVFTVCIWWIRSDLVWPSYPLRYAVTVYDRPEVVSLTEVKKLWQACTTLVCANLYSFCVYKGDRFKDTSILGVRNHYKPTEIFKYTLFSSRHPPGVSKGFIKDEALMLRRTNFSETTFHENIRQFKSHLHERGYPDTLVNKVLSEVKFEEGRVGTPTKRKDAQENSTFCHTIPPSGA